MGSMLELEKAVADLQRELQIEKATNKLVFSLIIEAVNKLSPKQNVESPRII